MDSANVLCRRNQVGKEKKRPGRDCESGAPLSNANCYALVSVKICGEHKKHF